MLLTFEATGRFLAVEAGNGFAALKTLPAHRFNFIITDVNSLKLIGFLKSKSAHIMQAVGE
jgi:hypothetical protein